MTSINQAVADLHLAYCSAMGIDLELTMADERRWLSASMAGMDPDTLKLVIHERRKRIREGVRFPESLYIRNLAGSEDAIADAMNEAAVVRAQMRVKVMDKGKAEVLRATGRSDEVNQANARPLGEVIAQMRKAVG